jgi:acetoin utilization deacetylase AcuC-like enzyme
VSAVSRDETVLDVFWHDDGLFHDTGYGLFEAAASPLLTVQTAHPENADRIRNIKSILQRGPIAPRLAWHAGRHASEPELTLFHDPAYVAQIKQGAREGRRLTATTLLPAGSWPALLAAAGTTIEAGRHARRSGRPAYALVRPPGHHAAPAVADGYCFFNNAAIAAAEAAASGLARVAVVDWDVHHGNGTQEGFYSRDDVLTISLHMDHGAWGPTHRQSGSVHERGAGKGVGFNLNLPLPMGASDSTYLLAFDALVAPRLRAFRPELIIVALGVDASQFDPNGRQLVTMAGFHALAARTRELSDELCGGRLLIVQEGGYNVAYTAFCVHASLEGFAGLPPSLPDPLAYMPAAEERSRADVAALQAAVQSAALETRR